MQYKDFHNIKKKAFTLVELLVVLAIVGILISIGFGAFIVFRDYIFVNNTAQSLKTAIRETEDKALTISSDGVSTHDVFNPPANIDNWIYGYSLEYDNSVNSTPTFREYRIYGPSIYNTLPSKVTSDTVKNAFANGGCATAHQLNNPSDFSLPNTPLLSGYMCHLEKNVSLDAKVSMSNCNIFFSSVNGNITLNSGQPNNFCYANIVQNTKSQTLTFEANGLGDIKICDGITTSICT